MKAKVHKMPAWRATADLPMPQEMNLAALDIGEVTGHNLEVRGREEVNRLLAQGWQLLHIYTLKYQEDGVWRERPMAILGRKREPKKALRDETAVLPYTLEPHPEL